MSKRHPQISFALPSDAALIPHVKGRPWVSCILPLQRCACSVMTSALLEVSCRSHPSHLVALRVLSWRRAAKGKSVPRGSVPRLICKSGIQAFGSGNSTQPISALHKSQTSSFRTLIHYLWVLMERGEVKLRSMWLPSREPLVSRPSSSSWSSSGTMCSLPLCCKRSRPACPDCAPLNEVTLLTHCFLYLSRWKYEWTYGIGGMHDLQ